MIHRFIQLKRKMEVEEPKVEKLDDVEVEPTIPDLQNKTVDSSANTALETPKSLPAETNGVIFSNNRYYCRFCKRVFYLLRFLEEHERNHTHPFKCKKCNESWAFFSGLNDHMKTGCAPAREPTPPPSRITIVNPAMFDPFYIPENEPYVPPDDFSDEETTTVVPVKSRKSVKSKKKVKSPKKEKKVKKTIVKQKTIKLKYKKTVVTKKKGDSKFKCRTCGKCWKNLYCLVKHERTHAKPHQCTHCSDRFAEFYQLRGHLQKYHTDTQSPTSMENGIDNNESPGSKDFNVPDDETGENQNGKFPIERPKAIAITSTTELSQRTKKEKAATQPKHYVTCTICSKSISSNSLRIHMRCHSGVKPYSCKLCPYASAQSGPLRNHMKRHNEVNAFKCKHCSASYKDMTTLLRHEKLHLQQPSSESSENDIKPPPESDTTYDFTPSPPSISKSPAKPTNTNKNSPKKPKTVAAHNYAEVMKLENTCKFCNKLFKSPIRLSTHELFHTVKHVCSICEVGFGKQGDLTRHFKSKVHQKRIGAHIDNISTKNKKLISTNNLSFVRLDHPNNSYGAENKVDDELTVTEVEVVEGDILDFDLNDYI